MSFLYSLLTFSSAQERVEGVRIDSQTPHRKAVTLRELPPSQLILHEPKGKDCAIMLLEFP